MNKSNEKNQGIDFDSKPLTIADVHEQTRIYMERISTNKVQIAGKVTDMRKTEPKMKYKKDKDGKNTDEPLLDENGHAQFWDSRHYVALAFEGGQLDIQIKPDWATSITVGNRVLFEGVKGLNFGSVQDVFHSYTIL